ncbi:unnamed protein product [Lactuca virosa]|uniref:DUF4283 domain-containing protein n=1 Tax=Lactuca virosa TaxID=75947 RepID=A0AAU9NCC5_9ASTR|nr:unnamed protein product [Lactuca virosa]
MSRVRCDHCILNVNIAKYQKQSKPNIGFEAMRRPPLPPPPIHLQRPKPYVFRGQRSYAEVVASECRLEEFSGSICSLVLVKHVMACRGWEACILSAEVINTQHISSMPTLLKLDNNVSGRIYYTGRLKLMIKFITPQDANAFNSNDDNWNRWFSWLKKGFNDSMEFDRITRVNIFGVPTRFRSNDNYYKIMEGFGTVIETYGGNWDALDISTGHIFLLTKSRKMINEEVEIKYGNMSYRVGIVEFYRDWSPFDVIMGDHHWFKHSENAPDGDDDVCSVNSISSASEENEENVGDSDDGVSETWVNPNTENEEPQEGEIVEEHTPDDLTVVNDSITPLHVPMKSPSGLPD